MTGAPYLQRFGLVVLIVMGLVLWPVHAHTAEPDVAQETTEDRQAVQDSVQDEATRQLDEKRKELIADAGAALDETEKALTALDDGDTRAALDSLALATGKLELIVARDPELALAPVGVDLISRDFVGDLETIEGTRTVIEEMIDDGKIQQARPLIRDFASELIVETTNLPLATYPEAIKLATAMIDEGDTEGAKRTVQTALATLVITEDVIPLPILRAELLLAKAEAGLSGIETAKEEAAQQEDADVTKPAEYVEAARKELEIAEALGYGVDTDYADVRESLEQLDEQIEAKDDTGGIFRTLADNFSELRARIFGDEA